MNTEALRKVANAGCFYQNVNKNRNKILEVHNIRNIYITKTSTANNLTEVMSKQGQSRYRTNKGQTASQETRQKHCQWQNIHLVKNQVNNRIQNGRLVY